MSRTEFSNCEPRLLTCLYLKVVYEPFARSLKSSSCYIVYKYNTDYRETKNLAKIITLSILKKQD